MALAHLALVGWFDAVYYGRFANEHQAGIFIKRIGTIEEECATSRERKATRTAGARRRARINVPNESPKAKKRKKRKERTNQNK